AAQSPQAKGRIERLWATLQDRLTSELRLRGIATLEAANAYLPEFLADFQRRFPTPPASPTTAWRPAPCDLELILSCRYRRVVAPTRRPPTHVGYCGRPLRSPPRPALLRERHHRRVTPGGRPSNAKRGCPIPSRGDIFIEQLRGHFHWTATGLYLAPVNRP